VSEKSIEEMKDAVLIAHPGSYPSEHQIYWVKIFTPSGVAISSAELNVYDAWADAFARISTAPAAASESQVEQPCA
jgi:hypothetical protein